MQELQKSRIWVMAALGLIVGGCDGESGGGAPGEANDAQASSCAEAEWTCTDYLDGEKGDAQPWLDYARNLDCPAEVTPNRGPGAARGACCHRGQPNSVTLDEFDAREAAGQLEPDELAVSTYRVNYGVTLNHPLTVGAAPLPSLATGRRDTMQETLVMQFGAPRSGGQWTSGEGWTEIGAAFYNCDDGSFSRYSETAAPVFEEGTFPNADSGDRYMVDRIPNSIDASQSGMQGFTTAWEDRIHGFGNNSFLDPAFAEYQWDYDLIVQDFELIAFERDDELVDCHGARDGDVWSPQADGLYEAFLPMAPNNRPDNGIITLQESTICTLFAFGVLSDEMDFATLDCETTERCTPGSADCRWKQLPDSLCPITDGELDTWECHLGDEAHTPDFDGDAVRCTADAPTERDATGDVEGQCCDPLGASDTLPACNAWRTLNDYTLASAVVREDVSDEVFRSCL